MINWKSPIVLTALVVGVLVLLGVGAMIAGKDQSSPISESSEAIDTSTWQTYENAKFGFSFRYPPGWNVEDNVQVDTDIGLIPNRLIIFSAFAQAGLRIEGWVNPAGWGSVGVKYAYEPKIIGDKLLLGEPNVRSKEYYQGYTFEDNTAQYSWQAGDQYFFFNGFAIATESDRKLLEGILSTFQFTPR